MLAQSAAQPNAQSRSLLLNKIQGENIWAIVVGIDNYKSPMFSPALQGYRNDAESNNIVLLQDQQATRSAIMHSIERLFVTNGSITAGSVVFFYFAGHGSRDLLSDSATVVETLCPYDQGYRVYSIAQPTLHKVFDGLEKAKKCNVVVILDSCHAGGMSPRHRRIQERNVGRTTNRAAHVRSAEHVKSQVLPDSFDRDIVKRVAKMIRPNSRVDANNRHETVGSVEHQYVVLAACGKEQRAHEIQYKGPDGTLKWRGAFTAELMGILCKLGEKRRSYYQIIADIKDRLSLVAEGQEPECRGASSYQRVFMHYHVDLSRKYQAGQAAAAGQHWNYGGR
ncbi:hypothetical protein DAEQUDRAFT_739510 [Daedalea quercina L-15889]|uniref:Peptidase C14 caspase domain-containing protein n=1 Tax=Daedalea quercina L-15889 TaxID=1314783 RepID=A0A165NSD6_9APHY|nr:hypothetical protein DAEQUDRAFT_739510 [Daedalea quercina L-15889]